MGLRTDECLGSEVRTCYRRPIDSQSSPHTLPRGPLWSVTSVHRKLFRVSQYPRLRRYVHTHRGVHTRAGIHEHTQTRPTSKGDDEVLNRPPRVLRVVEGGHVTVHLTLWIYHT